MLDQLRKILIDYIECRIDSIALEDWLIAHLQAILDSGDPEAIHMANDLDVLFLKLSDDALTDSEFVEQVAALTLKPRVLVEASTETTSGSDSQVWSRDPSRAGPLVVRVARV